jgi:hypothetical protein
MPVKAWLINAEKVLLELQRFISKRIQCGVLDRKSFMRRWRFSIYIFGHPVY